MPQTQLSVCNHVLTQYMTSKAENKFMFFKHHFVSSMESAAVHVFISVKILAYFLVLSLSVI